MIFLAQKITLKLLRSGKKESNFAI